MANHEEKATIKVDDFYNYITQHMTPEEALKKILANSIDHYDKLKVAGHESQGSPQFIIALAAMDLGWNIVIEKGENDKDLRGICCGTDGFLEKMVSK